MEPKTLADSALATGLIASPAWAGWLGDLNQALTTLTLIIGLLLGIARLIALYRERR